MPPSGREAGRSGKSAHYQRRIDELEQQLSMSTHASDPYRPAGMGRGLPQGQGRAVRGQPKTPYNQDALPEAPRTGSTYAPKSTPMGTPHNEFSSTAACAQPAQASSRRRRNLPVAKADSQLYAIMGIVCLVVVAMSYHSHSSHHQPPASAGFDTDAETAALASLRSRRGLEMSDRVSMIAKDLERLESEIARYTDKHEQYATEKAALAAEISAGMSGSRWRDDGRCGPAFPAPGAAAFGECDPQGNGDQKGPCCRPDSGFCGNEPHPQWGHCHCADCVDFSVVASQRLAMLAQLTGEVATDTGALVDNLPANRKSDFAAPDAHTGIGGVAVSTLAKFRPDGRCGPDFPAPGAPNFGECDPNANEDQKGPCCRIDSGWCGNIRNKRWGHCPPACRDCVDFGPPSWLRE